MGCLGRHRRRGARGPPQLREPAAAAVGRAGRHRCVSAGAGCRRGSERADAAAGAGREPAAWVIFFSFFSYFSETDMYMGLY